MGSGSDARKRTGARAVTERHRGPPVGTDQKNSRGRRTPPVSASSGHGAWSRRSRGWSGPQPSSTP